MFLFIIVEDDLMKELAEAREGRRAAERHREELVRQAKQMQNKTQNRRNHGTPYYLEIYLVFVCIFWCKFLKLKVVEILPIICIASFLWDIGKQ